MDTNLNRHIVLVRGPLSSPIYLSSLYRHGCDVIYRPSYSCLNAKPFPRNPMKSNGYTSWQIRVTHITSFCSRRGGGISPFVWNLADQQGRIGIVSDILALKDNHIIDIPRVCNSVKLYQGKVLGPSSFGYSVDLKNYINTSIRHETVLHSHGLWMYPGLAARRAATHTKVPRIVSPHGMLDHWALENSAWKKRLAGWLYENRNLRSADCIHALCESEYADIRDYGLVNPVAIIPNGIDPPKEEPKHQPPWIGRVDADRKIMLFLGRIHPKKGLENLIRAWSLVKPANWALAIAGWSQMSQEEKLTKLTYEKGLEREVIFIGPVFDEEKHTCLQNADAFILPSFSEGLPTSVLEAWAYKLPAIITFECNIPEGFEAGAAIGVRPEVESIIEGLESFIQLSEGRQKDMGLKGHQLITKNFSWSCIAQKMIEIYKWLLSKGPKPECVRVD